MAEYSVRDLTLGAGRPKICVPLCFENEKSFLTQMSLIDESPAEIVEWRADIYDMWRDVGSIVDMLEQIRLRLGDKPLIFTCRTGKEGGSADCDVEHYVNLTKAAVKSGKADIIDIEFSSGDVPVRELLDAAKGAGIAAIISYHNFAETPSVEDIRTKLYAMLTYDAEIYKVAYMPKAKVDVLNLMQAAMEFTSKRLDKMLISISMGSIGAVSRIMADFMGSPLTFASAGTASAPGQIEAGELANVLDFMQKY